ncbi:hypothetical protein ACJX0J_021060 [Zea mays]
MTKKRSLVYPHGIAQTTPRTNLDVLVFSIYKIEILIIFKYRKKKDIVVCLGFFIDRVLDILARPNFIDLEIYASDLVLSLITEEAVTQQLDRRSDLWTTAMGNLLCYVDLFESHVSEGVQLLG